MSAAPATPLYDDRIDTATNIGSGTALVLLWRSLKLLSSAKDLFIGKASLAILSIVPPLIIPWLVKIVVDQVILQQPFATTGVRFPPFMDPVVVFLSGRAPLEIMAWIVAGYLLLVIVFGTRAAGISPTGLTNTEMLPVGQDAATRSEQELSRGRSHSSGIVGVLETMIEVRLSQRVSNRLRTHLFEKLIHLPMTTLDDHRIGDSVYRVMYDTPQVPGICIGLALTPVVSLLGAVAAYYMVQYSYGDVAPTVVWVTGALVPFTLLATLPLSGIVRRVNQASRASGAATTNAMEESIDNIAAVQSLGGMDVESERFRARSAESFRRHRHVIFFEYFALAFSIFATAVGYFVIAVVVTEDVIAGRMSAGDWAGLFAIFSTLSATAIDLGLSWLKLQGNVAAVRRVFFFIDYATEDEAALKPDLPRLQHTVTVEHVDFTYPDGRRALEDVTLELRTGEMIAIVGPTGAGKTSLAYLLPRFLVPSAGRVLFDGTDLADVNLESLRDQVTYVFQEHTLLSESIRRNFQLVKPDATDAEIFSACDAAGAGEFVRNLPAGLDTVLGRGGDTLSVGQQQRLSIARGLIRDTPVLILDEPTAALDPQTENALVESLRDAARERLVVVIAHRLSTIRKADRIVFLDAGRVLETGDHDTLMTRPDSPYRRFVELQGG